MSDGAEMTPNQETDSAASELSFESPSAVEDFVHFQIRTRLQGDKPTARAARAQLRSALGKEVGSVPAIWRYTLDGLVDPSGATAKEYGDDITSGERAVHAALTLWAFHQGSHTKAMHRRGRRNQSLGAAVRNLALTQRVDPKKGLESTTAYKRLSAAVLAPTIESLEYQVHGIISLLRAAEIPLDYGRFAADLVKWQNPQLRSSVLRQWGRDFARTPKLEETEDHD